MFINSPYLKKKKGLKQNKKYVMSLMFVWRFQPLELSLLNTNLYFKIIRLDPLKTILVNILFKGWGLVTQIKQTYLLEK